jgi:hypothetical protein
MLTLASTQLGRVGANSIGLTPGSLSNVFTGAANVRGAVLRTIYLTANAGFFCDLIVGGVLTYPCGGSQTFWYTGPGIMVPAGLAVQLDGNGGPGNNRGVLTWDYL